QKRRLDHRHGAGGRRGRRASDRYRHTRADRPGRGLIHWGVFEESTLVVNHTDFALEAPTGPLPPPRPPRGGGAAGRPVPPAGGAAVPPVGVGPRPPPAPPPSRNIVASHWVLALGPRPQRRNRDPHLRADRPALRQAPGLPQPPPVRGIDQVRVDLAPVADHQ